MNSIELAQAEFLPAAQLIARYVTDVISKQGLAPDRAVRTANARLSPDQRFYSVEYDHASIILWRSFPYLNQGAWRIKLGNNMGYRLVEMPICRYGYVVDPVTRQCVEEYVDVVSPEPEPTEEVEPTEPTEEKAKLSGVVLLLIGLGVALLFLRRK